MDDPLLIFRLVFFSFSKLTPGPSLFRHRRISDLRFHQQQQLGTTAAATNNPRVHRFPTQTAARSESRLERGELGRHHSGPRRTRDRSWTCPCPAATDEEKVSNDFQNINVFQDLIGRLRRGPIFKFHTFGVVQIWRPAKWDNFRTPSLPPIVTVILTKSLVLSWQTFHLPSKGVTSFMDDPFPL